jgi:hypothetical protein
MGRLTFNIFDAEGGPGVGGMFYDGLYIKKTDKGVISTKKVLSIGASLDWQARLNVLMKAGTPPADPNADVPLLAKSRTDYFAFAGDVFWDIPLTTSKLVSINGQVNFYYYDHGDRSEQLAYYNTTNDKKSFTGWGLLSELGIRYSAFQPLIIFDFYDSTKALTDNQGDLRGIYGGLNYYLLGHSVTFKLQAGSKKSNGDNWLSSVNLQAQLVF